MVDGVVAKIGSEIRDDRGNERQETQRKNKLAMNSAKMVKNCEGKLIGIK